MTVSLMVLIIGVVIGVHQKLRSERWDSAKAAQKTVGRKPRKQAE